jgi:tetratricopeptide (TPR) repeat protein
MSLLAAERSFSEGLAALAASRHAQAAKLFLQAMELERTCNVSRPDMRYLSYYGLSVAHAGGRAAAGLRACRDAVAQEPHKPIFLLNLGRAYLACGDVAQALNCFRKGAALAPSHRPLRRELARLCRQRRVRSTGAVRRHAAHRWLRQIRSRWQRGVPRWLALSRGCPLF